MEVRDYNGVGLWSRERLRGRIVGLLLAGTIRREFREYAKLLRHIGLGHWWPEIERRVDRNNPYVMRYFDYFRRSAVGVK